MLLHSTSEHVLDLVLDPVPQDSEHWDHGDQDSQFPSQSLKIGLLNCIAFFVREISYSLGEHSAVSTWSPRQWFPPFLGGGSVHDLCRLCKPGLILSVLLK